MARITHNPLEYLNASSVVGIRPGGHSSTMTMTTTTTTTECNGERSSSATSTLPMTDRHRASNLSSQVSRLLVVVVVAVVLVHLSSFGMIFAFISSDTVEIGCGIRAVGFLAWVPGHLVAEVMRCSIITEREIDIVHVNCVYTSIFGPYVIDRARCILTI